MAKTVWKEKTGSIATLGDAEGQVKSAEGKLVRIEPSKKFDGKKNYVLEQSDGAELTVFGSAFIENRVSDNDVGKLIRFEYEGVDKKTRAKIIKVLFGE